MRLVLLGPPGAGKGTQGEALAHRYGVTHISSGELFRQQIAADTPLGRKVRQYLADGLLVPDDLVFDLIGAAVSQSVASAGGYVLDGFPRTLAQAERAHDMAAQAGVVADAVVLLVLPDDIARQRVLGRADGADSRIDDHDRAVIDRRLAVYHAETEPLIDFYQRRGVLATIDASGTPEQVTSAAIEAIQRLAPAR